jgi:predicted RNA polymerase sigma factor
LGRRAEAAADFERAVKISPRAHIRRLAAARLKQMESAAFVS